MQRLALVFTVLVFSVVLGGYLTRRGAHLAPMQREFEPASAPELARLVDPLLVASGAAQAQRSRLSVRIVDPSGAPVAEAALVVRSGIAPIWAFTAADGTATLEGLQPEAARLCVLAFPHPGLEVDVVPGPELRVIELAAPATVQATLADIPRAKLAGQLVSDAADPLDGYEVLLLPVAPANELGGALPRRCVTEAGGAYVFEGLAHGRYFVKVLPSWASGGSWPDLAGPEDRELDFRGEISSGKIGLARGSIEGEVRDDLGRALEGALVLVNESANEARVWPPCSTGPDGRFHVDDLPPGKYRVSCRAGEGGSTQEELVVAAGTATEATLPHFAARKKP
ncbi:MAG TPA: carboxypeptidase-like regulatory domain-containing protein [Planctomycetota bacterium]|nr:carboxypeptidase-like regulatory domain-containing protein [Planctomycetota bacterium]